MLVAVKTKNVLLPIHSIIWSLYIYRDIPYGWRQGRQVHFRRRRMLRILRRIFNLRSNRGRGNHVKLWLGLYAANFLWKNVGRKSADPPKAPDPWAYLRVDSRLLLLHTDELVRQQYIDGNICSTVKSNKGRKPFYMIGILNLNVN